MPYWSCDRCGARLYSASRRLKRQFCPVCEGRLSLLADLTTRFGRQADPGERPNGAPARGPRQADGG